MLWYVNHGNADKGFDLAQRFPSYLRGLMVGAHHSIVLVRRFVVSFKMPFSALRRG
jgi:hypothetical protein